MFLASFKMSPRQLFGRVNLLFGTSTCHIEVLDSSPDYAVYSSFLLLCILEGSSCGLDGWIAVTHMGDMDWVLGCWLQSDLCWLLQAFQAVHQQIRAFLSICLFFPSFCVCLLASQTKQKGFKSFSSSCLCCLAFCITRQWWTASSMLIPYLPSHIHLWICSQKEWVFSHDAWHQH